MRRQRRRGYFGSIERRLTTFCAAPSAASVAPSAKCLPTVCSPKRRATPRSVCCCSFWGEGVWLAVDNGRSLVGLISGWFDHGISWCRGLPASRRSFSVPPHTHLYPLAFVSNDTPPSLAQYKPIYFDDNDREAGIPVKDRLFRMSGLLLIALCRLYHVRPAPAVRYTFQPIQVRCAHAGAVLCVTALFCASVYRAGGGWAIRNSTKLQSWTDPCPNSIHTPRTHAHPLPLAPIRQERLRILVERAHIHPTIAAALVSSFRVAAYLRNKAQYHYYREREDMYRYVPFLVWKGFRGG